MEIYAKSKLDQNMYDKMKKGAEAIEIHLDDNYLNESADSALCKTVSIRIVHAPLVSNCDATLETVHGREALITTCDLAAEIAKKQNHSIIVVCHLETHPDTLKTLGLYDDLVDYMKWLVEAYPELEFAIENVPHVKKKGNELRFRDINYLAPIILAKDVNNPRVGTCLDICHALIEMRFMKHTLPYFNGVELEANQKELEQGLNAYFKAYKDTIKLIHLATAKSHGVEHDHGLPFEEEDATFLKGIVDLYYMNNYKCPVTIEVKEDDYSDAQGFDKTNKLLRKILKEREAVN